LTEDVTSPQAVVVQRTRTGDTALNAGRRAADLAALSGGGPAVDVLVVGLGVTGAGVALDAASRGLSVAAIDAYDLAFGTSRFSSKLIHGGLRYLARFDLAVAYESAVERAILMRRTAPHLIRPLPLVAGGGGLPFGAAVAAGDVLRRAAGTGAALPAPRRLTAAEVRAWAPALAGPGGRGGILMWEGQLVDDARLVVALARTAAGFGARIVTRCRAVRLTGRGADVVDTLTGAEHGIRARTVVNATGVWAGGLVPGVTLRPSRGSHLIVPSTVLSGGSAGLLVPVSGERNRYVFLLPQLDGTVHIGLTDEPVDGPLPEVPEPPESDVDFLLHAVNAALAEPLRRADVLGAYAGLRPLLAGRAEKAPADLSRRHTVLAAPNGVITVVGGKLTTYRRMAQQAVDLAVRRGGLACGPCRTRALPLVGAAPPARLAAVRAPRRLVARYGTEAPAVHAVGELAFGIRAEGALCVDDLLDRRLRVGLVPVTRAAAEPPARAALAAAGGLTTCDAEGPPARPGG
jgi:glycerol-3-phosphate dehydrogenase